MTLVAFLNGVSPIRRWVQCEAGRVIDERIKSDRAVANVLQRPLANLFVQLWLPVDIDVTEIKFGPIVAFYKATFAARRDERRCCRLRF